MLDLAAVAWLAVAEMLRSYVIEVSARDPDEVTATDVRIYLRSHETVDGDALNRQHVIDTQGAFSQRTRSRKELLR